MAAEKKKKIGFRTWLSIITMGLLAVTIYFAWPEIVEAWGLMGRVNIWIFLLLIPIQILSYYAISGMIFSYLEGREKIPGLNRRFLTRVALELNFVNHIIPSGGVIGFTYLGWLLKDYGVSPARATMSQIVRFLLHFVSFVVLMFLALIWMIYDHQVSRTLVIMSALLTFGTIFAVVAAVFLLNSQKRLDKFAGWLVRTGNFFIRIVTFGHKKRVFKREPIDDFFGEMHKDYIAVRKDKKILWRPFWWSIWAQIFDVMLYQVAFWSLGYFVNPAVLFIGMGLASVGGVLSLLPAGAGVSEAVMVGFLASSGVPLDVALAGTLLTRVTLVAGTILFGYFFYQATVAKHGQSPVKR